MKTEIIITENFQKEAKRYLKKFKSLRTELQKLNSQLLENPKIGTPIGNNTFKIRLAVKSKGKGKSGGFRIISHLDINIILSEHTNKVYLLSIYDKSETGSISSKEIERIIKRLK